MLLENIQEKFQHIDKFLNIEFESVQGNESTVGQSKEIVDLGTDGRTTSRTEVGNLNIQRVSLSG